MKKTFVLLFVFFATLSASLCAQSSMHTIYDTDEPLGECLFPMDENGNIEISDIVNLNDAKAEDIKNAIHAYIEDYIIKNEIDKKQALDEPLILTYKLEYPIGKEEIQFTVWGAPVFSFQRDVSKITFMVKIQVREGKFKYSLSDFWTSRRMIHGEGKNNGPSNIIHWQRVHSLTKERDDYARKHNPEKRNTQETLYDYNKQIQYEHHQYQMEYNAVMDFIAGLQNIKSANKTNNDFEEDVKPIKKHKPTIVPLDITNYKGNLLSLSNRVCIIPSHLSNSGEWAGVNELKKQITIDNPWEIVNFPEQAHFIIEYVLETEGRDKAYIKIMSRDRSICYTSRSVNAGESISDNREAANDLYQSALVPTIKVLLKNKTNSIIKQFTL